MYDKGEKISRVCCFFSISQKMPTRLSFINQDLICRDPDTVQLSITSDQAQVLWAVLHNATAHQDCESSFIHDLRDQLYRNVISHAN